MRFGGEKVLMVRFGFLGARARTHTHTAEAKVIKCHLINLFSAHIYSFEIFHHEKCFKRTGIYQTPDG